MTVFYTHRFVHTVRNGDPHCLVLEARMETGLQGLRFGSVAGKASGMGSGVTEVPMMTDLRGPDADEEGQPAWPQVRTGWENSFSLPTPRILISHMWSCRRLADATAADVWR